MLGSTPFEELGMLAGKTPKGYPENIPPPLANRPGWNFFYFTPTIAPKVLWVNIRSPRPAAGYLFPKLGYPCERISSIGLTFKELA